MADYLWLFATAGGAFILGAAIIYGVMRQRHLSSGEQARQDRKVNQLYNR